MKTLITLCCLLLSIFCTGQNFEGVIKWSITNEVTDPVLKAKMEENQKRMNDPANQAKLKEMKEKMNDPKLKAVLDANPQMKAQMENTMKMQGASLMPTGFIVKIKNNNTRTAIEGGMMTGVENLYIASKNQTYVLNTQNKSYSVFTERKNPEDQEPPVITKTSETQKILNYECTKTIVTVTEAGKTFEQIFWTTNDIKDFDFKNLSKQRTSSGQSMFYEGVGGVPLKMELTTMQGKMIMEITEIKKEPLSDKVFEIPAGFTEIKMPGRP